MKGMGGWGLKEKWWNRGMSEIKRMYLISPQQDFQGLN